MRFFSLVFAGLFFLLYVDGKKTIDVVLKSGGDNYVDNDGRYVETGEKAQGRALYFNNAKSRILAYNGNRWVITASSYKDDIVSGTIGAGFGGFKQSTSLDTEIEFSVWADYDLYASMNLVQNNYANCDGVYSTNGTALTLQGYPVYINKAKSRFLGYNGNRWIITGTQWLDSIVSGNKAGWGGFHSSTNTGTDASNAKFGPYIVNNLPASGTWSSAGSIVIPNDESTSIKSIDNLVVIKLSHKTLAILIGVITCLVTMSLCVCGFIAFKILRVGKVPYHSISTTSMDH